MEFLFCDDTTEQAVRLYFPPLHTPALKRDQHKLSSVHSIMKNTTKKYKMFYVP